ncbi:AAA family ATPase [Candidatus Bathyarchaeota archaeon]|nr:AAA family ATPase [Candidatus Bathyarchaeota archaeon]
MGNQESWKETVSRCRKHLERFRPDNERIRVFIGFEVEPALSAADNSYAESPEEALEIAEDEDRVASKLRAGEMPDQTKSTSRMSARERALNFGEHLEELRMEKRFLVLPMMVKTVKIENIGPIKEFNATFSKGANIVYGPAGCGKTIFVRTLDDYLSGRRRLRYELTHGKDEGYVSVIPHWPQTTIPYAQMRSAVGAARARALIREAEPCALLDEPAPALSKKEDTWKFLFHVKTRFAQVILTTQYIDKWNFPGVRLLKMHDRHGLKS